MKAIRYCLIIAAVLLAVEGAVFALAAEEKPLTRAEKSGFTDTSSYAEVVGFITSLQRRASSLRVETMCVSAEGRKVPLMVLGDPVPSSPLDLKGDDRAVVYIQANIHAGEVEGKEASLMLARDILMGETPPLLDGLVILIAPIFNPDGNEKVSLKNRTNQAGPDMGVGVRHNGQMLDLNRDCVKVETPEIEGMIKNVLGRWDPLLMVDCHTTNGSYHREPVTYSWPLNPNGDRGIIEYMRDRMMPAVSKALEEEHGVLSIPYGRWIDVENPRKGWRTYGTEARYVTNYVGLRNRFAILDENYAYADYKTRLEGCYYLLLRVCEYVRRHRDEMRNIAVAADRRLRERWKNSSTGDSFVVSSEARALEEPVRIKSWDMKVTRVEGEWPRVEKTGTEREFKVPYFADFAPVRRTAFPKAYIIPLWDRRIEGVLHRHGIVVEKLVEPAVLKVEEFVTEALEVSEHLYQGHRFTSLSGEYRRVEKEFPRGALYVGTDQPLGSLAACLLEPESGDGLVAWNFFDRYLLTQWRRKLLPCPVYRLLEPAGPAKETVMP